MRQTREHKPLDQATIETIIAKRAEARFADQQVIDARRTRKPRDTFAAFMQRVDRYLAQKKGKRR